MRKGVRKNKELPAQNVRVAVLIYGQPRFLEETARSIKEEFTIDGCETDFFYHSWPHVGYEFFDEFEEKNDSLDKKSLENKFAELYNPVSGYVSDNDDELRAVLQNLTDIAEFLDKEDLSIKIPQVKQALYYTGQFYSIGEAVRQKIEYEKDNNFNYNVVIKVRTDIFFKGVEFYKNRKKYQREKYKFYILPVLKNPNTVFSRHIKYLRGKPVFLTDENIDDFSAALVVKKLSWDNDKILIESHKELIPENESIKIIRNFDKLDRLLVTAHSLHSDSKTSNLCWLNILNVYIILYLRNLYEAVKNKELDSLITGEGIEGQAIINNKISMQINEQTRSWKVVNERSGESWRKGGKFEKYSIFCNTHENMVRQLKLRLEKN